MKIPVRSLAKLNWLLAVVFSGFVGIFVFTYTGISSEAIFTVVQSAISILVVGFLHLWVRVRLSRYRNKLSIKKQQLYQFAISYAVTILYSICISPVSARDPTEPIHFRGAHQAPNNWIEALYFFAEALR